MRLVTALAVDPSTRTKLPSESTDNTLAAALVVVAEADVILANLIPEADPLLPENVEVAPTDKVLESVVAPPKVVAPDMIKVCAASAVAVVVASVEVPEE